MHSVVIGSISSGENHGICTLLMKPNNVETTVQWFRMSREVLAEFSGHFNSIYNIIHLFKNKKGVYISVCV